MAQLTAEELKRRIFDPCKEPCRGTGYIVEHGGKGKPTRLVDCPCMVRYKTLVRYLRAGIPERFWEFTLRDLTAGFRRQNEDSIGLFKVWLDALDRLIPEGAGLLLHSQDHGTAKSAMAALAATRAVDGNHRILWLSGPALYPLMRSSGGADHRPAALDMFDKLDRTDLVILDEVDKIYFPDTADTTMTSAGIIEIFDRIYRQRTAVVATANRPLGELHRYPSAIVDRAAEWDTLGWIGVDYRKGVSHLKRLVKEQSTGGTRG